MELYVLPEFFPDALNVFMAKSPRELLSLQYEQRIENCPCKVPISGQVAYTQCIFVRKIVGVSGQVSSILHSSLEKRFNLDKLLKLMRCPEKGGFLRTFLMFTHKMQCLSRQGYSEWYAPLGAVFPPLSRRARFLLILDFRHHSRKTLPMVARTICAHF